MDISNKDIINDTINGRIYHLDIIKGILIILMLYDHGPLLPYGSIFSNITMLIAEMAVAQFILISGAEILTRDITVDKFFSRIIKTYLSMVFWKLLYFLLSPWVFSFDLSRVSIGDFIVYLLFFGNIPGIETTHFWFSHAYLSLLIVSPILRSFIVHSRTIKVYTLKKDYEIDNDNSLNSKPEKSGMKISKEIVCHLIFRFLPLFICYFLSIFPYSIYLLSGKNGTFLSELNPFGSYSYLLFHFVLGGYLASATPKTSEIITTPTTSATFIKMLLLSLSMLFTGIVIQLLLYQRYFNSLGWQGQNLPGHTYMSSAILIAEGTFFLLRTFILSSFTKYTKSMGKLAGKCLSFIGKHTLYIYYFHMIPMTAILTILSTKKGIEINLIKSLLLLIPCLLTGIILKALKKHICHLFSSHLSFL